MSSSAIINDFIGTFALKHDDRRWPAFKEIAISLISLSRPVNILETGCAREEGNWSGDGQSTVMWDWIISHCGGTAVSVDISEKSCAVARKVAPNVSVVCSDSIIALRAAKNIECVDFIYLDSYDVTRDYRAPLHHIGELASVYDRLRSGCMIAVDDCLGEFGKDKYIRMFFKNIGVEPVIDGHITVWRKP